MSGDTTSFISVGPAGKASAGDTVQAWEETHKNITRILISSCDEYICGLQFQYMEGGKEVLSQTYGTLTGQNFKTVKLEEWEEITGLSGVVGSDDGISSIKIKTTRKAYGPIGGSVDEYDDKFNFYVGRDNEFRGFYGTFGEFRYTPKTRLTSIGVYMKI